VNQPVLQVRDLRVYYHTKRGAAKAVDGVTFALQARERFGLVGESGSGKSTTGLAILRLIKPPGRIEGGEVLLDGLNVLDMPEEQVRGLRLATIALVAQGAMNSLNPVLRVREQLIDALADHRIAGGRRDYDRRVGTMLAAVGLPQEVASRYPHELSGGMKQRVCIAIAISLRPKIIIADEPTSALDVVVQRQVMDTLRTVQEAIGAAVILIGHDMGLMAQFVDRLGVMYAGELVEVSPVEELFEEPLHPYTQLLVECLPSIERKGVLEGIPGLPPSLLDRPAGCPFHPRCPFVMDRCRVEQPCLVEVRPQRWVACHLYGGAA
jgi:oligopeptide/dipeptide ABC transporter ATP-binding protein